MARSSSLSDLGYEAPHMVFTLLVALVTVAEPSSKLDRLVGTWAGRLDTVLDDAAVKGAATWACERFAGRGVTCRRSLVMDDGLGTHEDVATFGFDGESRHYTLLIVADDVERQYEGDWKDATTLELKREADDAVTTVTLGVSDKKVDFRVTRSEAGKTTPVTRGTLARKK